MAAPAAINAASSVAVMFHIVAPFGTSDHQLLRAMKAADTATASEEGHQQIPSDLSATAGQKGTTDHTDNRSSMDRRLTHGCALPTHRASAA